MSARIFKRVGFCRRFYRALGVKRILRIILAGFQTVQTKPCKRNFCIGSVNLQTAADRPAEIIFKHGFFGIIFHSFFGAVDVFIDIYADFSVLNDYNKEETPIIVISFDRSQRFALFGDRYFACAVCRNKYTLLVGRCARKSVDNVTENRCFGVKIFLHLDVGGDYDVGHTRRQQRSKSAVIV